MAFIAIDAKADVTGEKKGKITPAQHSQLNSFVLTKKTGILDCLGKCLAKNATISIVDNIANIEFNSGYLVICGRLVQCEQGTVVQVNTSTYPSGVIVAKYNLNESGNNEFSIIVKSSTNLQQDDLNNNILGTYEFALYEFTTNNNMLSLTRTNNAYVKSVEDNIEEINNELEPLSDYDISKGTIESRLANLGFKSGAITLLGTQYSSAGLLSPSGNGLYRQGNFVFAKYNSFSIDGVTQTTFQNYLSDGSIMFTLPEGFRPKNSLTCYVGFSFFENKAYSYITKRVTINTDGTGVVKGTIAQSSPSSFPQYIMFDFSFGFLAN